MNKKYENKFQTMVICSTLNQMVNYLAIKDHGKDCKKIYIIRMDKDSVINKKFNYDEWDENLKEVLNETDGHFDIEYICYSYNEIKNHEEIISKFKTNIKEEKVLWNITGGQRHFVMAITEYIFKEENRDRDIILYFDGDTDEYYYYSKNGFNNCSGNSKKEEYHMNIPIALRLMGFKVKKNSIKISNKENNGEKEILKYYRNLKETSPYYKYLSSSNYKEFLDKYDKDEINNKKQMNIQMAYNIIDKEYRFYDKFYDAYANKKNDTLRKILVNSNTFKGNDRITVFDKIKEDIIAHKENIVNYNEVFTEDNFKVLKESIGNHQNGKVFGYILEKMTFYHIIKVLKENESAKDKIRDIDISVKIEHVENRDNKESSSETIDEFDILMVTKKGKVIMIECKSGGMTGDNAKSHNYSIYKIAGVYGTPNLINPLLANEESGKKFFKTKINSLNDSEMKENEDVYKYIRLAKKAAEKVGLDVWAIDSIDIEKNLKDIL